MDASNNPTVSNLKNVLDQAEDGSFAMPVTVASATSGPINKNPTIGRLEQALVVAEDGSMAMPVEVVKLADDGSTFERVTEFSGGGGGGGTSEPVTWSNVQNKPETFPPTAHNHDDRYYTKTDIDNAGYLLAQPDGETVEIQGGELKARALTGLHLGVAQLNTWLSGTQGNIQGQLNEITLTLAALSSGMRYLGKFETKADLNVVTNKDNGDLAVVLADETRNNARSMYIYNDSLGTWDFIGAFEFSDAFTSLTDTPNVYDNGKYLRSGINGLYFDAIRYNDIEGRPDRTKAQIENAADKTHDHTNITHLNKISADVQGNLTFNGVPYVPATQSKQHLYVRRGGTDQAIPGGTNLVFDSALITDGGIPYNNTTGVFTLQAGKRYTLDVVIHISGGNSTLEIRDATTLQQSTDALAVTYPNPVNRDVGYGGGGVINAIITPQTTRGYVIRAISGSADAKLYRYASTLRIVEI